MGMFDTIIVKQDLPVTDAMKRLNIDSRLNLLRGTNSDRKLDEMCTDFQTKDLLRCFVIYILKDNKLYIQKYKEVNNADDLKYDKNDFYLEDVNYHGTVNFYTGINDVMDRFDVWVEYTAYFTHGILDKIELHSFTEKSNEERRNKEIKWKHQQDYERNIWYNKYIFHRKLWRKFQFKIWHKGWYNLGEICHKISNVLP